MQLHLRCLYELKSDLHVLYAGARVLGATENATTNHSGILSEGVLDRMRRGVVRKAAVPHSDLSAEVQEGLASFMKAEPCPLLELNLEFSTSVPPAGGPRPELARPAFDGWDLRRLLEPTTGTLACRRLRHLNLGPGLSGTIPESLSQCVELHSFNLTLNGFTGPFPPWIHKLTKLEVLLLGSNKLSGPIPESIGGCKRLKLLQAPDNQLGGRMPIAALLRLVREGALCMIDVGSALDQYETEWSPWLLAMGRERGFVYEDGSANKDLIIPDEDVAALRDALLERIRDTSKPLDWIALHLPPSHKSATAVTETIEKAIEERKAIDAAAQA